MGPIWLLSLVGKKAAGLNRKFERGLGEENAGLVIGCTGERGAAFWFAKRWHHSVCWEIWEVWQK